MLIKDIFEITANNATVIIRCIIDNMNYDDHIATWENIDKLCEDFSDASVMCLVPEDGKLIIEIA